jgi:hypothetical protein
METENEILKRLERIDDKIRVLHSFMDNYHRAKFEQNEEIIKILLDIRTNTSDLTLTDEEKELLNKKV